jgi:hypothetical protein
VTFEEKIRFLNLIYIIKYLKMRLNNFPVFVKFSKNRPGKIPKKKFNLIKYQTIGQQTPRKYQKNSSQIIKSLIKIENYAKNNDILLIIKNKRLALSFEFAQSTKEIIFPNKIVKLIKANLRCVNYLKQFIWK